METINELTMKNLKMAEQLEHRRQQEKYATKKREKKLREVLIFKVGELVLDCWPWVSTLELRRTKAENEMAFAPLRKILLKIASDPNYTTPTGPIATARHSNFAKGK